MLKHMCGHPRAVPKRELGDGLSACASAPCKRMRQLLHALQTTQISRSMRRQ